MAGYIRKTRLSVKESFSHAHQAWEQGKLWYDTICNLEDFKENNIVLNIHGPQLTLLVFEESKVTFKVTYSEGGPSKLIVVD